ncbi:MAG TPA: extracellular solute-binding protein [Acidimicrobiales bacterium]|nr:extracellular solute-binding protein [Acidimicrobiales bacterium]
MNFASGTSLNVLCEAGGHLELTPIANLFKTTTGHTVNLTELPYNGLYDRVYNELSNGSVTFDILAGDATWIPTFAPGLVKLDSFFTPAVKADLFPATLQEAQYRGTYYGVPQWTNVEILYYRKDLFEDTTEQANFKSKYGYDLSPPTTWQQFTDAAQFFTRGTTLYGTDVDNYVIQDAEGVGHYVGCVLSIDNHDASNQAYTWPGEGDDMIFIDGEAWPPSLHGTGTEDYFNAAWGFPSGAYAGPYHGISLASSVQEHFGLWSMYRFHIEDPVRFARSVRVTIEHGHANDQGNDYSSVAYWYQHEPHRPLPPLPPIDERLPRRWPEHGLWDE